MAANFEISENLGTIRTNDKGQRLEINRVSWYGNKPKIDIRYWAVEGDQHLTPGKGLTLSEKEYEDFVAYFKEGVNG